MYRACGGRDQTAPAGVGGGGFTLNPKPYIQGGEGFEDPRAWIKMRMRVGTRSDCPCWLCYVGRV